MRSRMKTSSSLKPCFLAHWYRSQSIFTSSFARSARYASCSRSGGVWSSTAFTWSRGIETRSPKVVTITTFSSVSMTIFPSWTVPSTVSTVWARATGAGARVAERRSTKATWRYRIPRRV